MCCRSEKHTRSCLCNACIMRMHRFGLYHQVSREIANTCHHFRPRPYAALTYARPHWLPPRTGRGRGPFPFAEVLERQERTLRRPEHIHEASTLQASRTAAGTFRFRPPQWSPCLAGRADRRSRTGRSRNLPAPLGPIAGRSPSRPLRPVAGFAGFDAFTGYSRTPPSIQFPAVKGPTSANSITPAARRRRRDTLRRHALASRPPGRFGRTADGFRHRPHHRRGRPWFGQ